MVTAGAAAIDPIPGEIPERQARHAGPLRGLEGERRDVTEHHLGPDRIEPSRFVADQVIPPRFERIQRGNRCREVDRQAVGLDHADVRRYGLDRQTAVTVCEQPARGGTAHVNASLRHALEQLGDHFAHPYRVTEAVARDVDGDRARRHYARARLRRIKLRTTPRSRTSGWPSGSRT